MLPRLTSIAVGPMLWALIVLAAVLVTAAPGRAEGSLAFERWSDPVFERAKRENRFVLLSLQSHWCPWCETMNTETYSDPRVQAVIAKHYIPVRVDQDSRPDISQRFERWGWPATVLFGPDGSEIVKLRGFYSPQFFLPILEATVADPTPVDYGPSGGPEEEKSRKIRLASADREALKAFLDQVHDPVNGGWGRGKYVDPMTFVYALEQAKVGDATAAARARQAVDALRGMVDPETGAVAQVSLGGTWSRPLREYPMFAQDAGLRSFALAYALWGDPAFRVAADRVYQFFKRTLAAPEGGFYTSLGLEKHKPGLDRNRYARETGMAIGALIAYHDATGEGDALRLASAAAEWALNARALTGPDRRGGFRHGDSEEEGGPFLGDSLFMGQAFLALHRATGERRWLTHAIETADFISRTFVDARSGGFLAAATPDASFMKTAVKQKDDNVTATRFFTLLAAYTGSPRHREVAETGLGYLASPAVREAFDYLPDLLQVDYELSHEPVHVTVIGCKDDPAAAALYRAALRYPLSHKRAEWWDRQEGPLVNPDVRYPDYPEAAAFACTRTFCSLPVTDPAQVASALDRLQRALP